MNRSPTSVVEHSGFRAKASRLLGDAGRAEYYLAANPRAGKEYDGTGGIRHFRWPLEVSAKKEQFEVGYYYGDGSTPVLLVTLIRAKEGNLLSKVIRGLAAGA